MEKGAVDRTAFAELVARLMAVEQAILATFDPKQRERYFHQVEENRRGLSLPPLQPGRDPLQLVGERE